MAIVSKTVTVNAAFLLEIKEDDRRLRHLLSELHNLCGAPSGGVIAPARLAELLVAVRDQLAIHFSLEEAYGYFDDPIEAAPRLCLEAEQLRNQHEELFRTISMIANRASNMAESRPAQEAVRQVAEVYLEFHDQLRRHETRENQLIQSAFNDDIGVGD